MKIRRLKPESNYIVVNGFEIHSMQPTQLYTAVFECMFTKDIHFRSSEALKELYFGLLDVVSNICEEERIVKKGSSAAAYTRYMSRCRKQKLVLISVVRKLRKESEEEAQKYMLGVLYNEALRGYDDVCRIRGDYCGLNRKEFKKEIVHIPKLKGEM